MAKKQEQVTRDIDEMTDQKIKPSPAKVIKEVDTEKKYFDAIQNRWRKKYRKNGKLTNDFYMHELVHLQEELVKLQYWIREKGLRIVIVFEGRDARERSQWYFQRWSSHLPAAGEVVLFDRSWYTRSITGHVMGFCTENEYREFLRSCPQYERMLVRSGIILLKYWFSVSDEEQERRFQLRAADPKRRWKLSPMDIRSRDKWEDYSKAKDRMFDYTDIKQAPWYVVNADDKKRARLNCIHHIVSMIPYEDILPDPIELPPRAAGSGYIRPPFDEQTFVPTIY